MTNGEKKHWLDRIGYKRLMCAFLLLLGLVPGMGILFVYVGPEVFASLGGYHVLGVGLAISAPLFVVNALFGLLEAYGKYYRKKDAGDAKRGYGSYEETISRVIITASIGAAAFANNVALVLTGLFCTPLNRLFNDQWAAYALIFLAAVIVDVVVFFPFVSLLLRTVIGRPREGEPPKAGT
jgi:MFS family permease